MSLLIYLRLCMKRIVLCWLLGLTTTFIQAQPVPAVQWASRLIGFSSELHINKTPRQYGAAQVLGKPSKLPSTGSSPCAWSPAAEAWSSEEWVKVGYKTPMRIRQLAIAENFNAGCITKIYAYDAQDKEYLLYVNTKDTTHVPGRMLNIFFKEETSFKVASLKLILNTRRIPGFNQIDAVGISNSLEPIKAVINLSKEAPKQLEKENLSRTINGPTDEICPVISPDGKTLYFTRAERSDNQDVWYSKINPNNSFSQAQNIGAPINTPDHNSSFSITPDGNTMLLNNVYLPNGTMQKGLSVTRRTTTGWSFPEKVQIVNYKNDNDYAEFSLAQNGNVMVMTLQREDSYGSKDLYVSFLQPDKTWSEPKNMGAFLNTADAETSPFIASDGITLYYSTPGLSGFGSNDIFVSKRLDNSWTNWSEPQNLGPSLNTDGWDAYFTIPASGEYAYFVSTKNSFGENDIFRAKLDKALRPEPVALVYGTVYNAGTNKPMEANIAYETKPKGSEGGKASSAPATGEYKIVLPLKKHYLLAANASGFMGAEELVDLTKDTAYREIRRDLYLLPVEVGQTVRLNNILFEQSKFELLESSFPELNRVAMLLKSNPNMVIQLEGHTDNQGDFMLNVELSKNRVLAVKQYLEGQGVEGDRIRFKAYGSMQPIASNTSEDNRKKNRRVEFVILKK